MKKLIVTLLLLLPLSSCLAAAVVGTAVGVTGAVVGAGVDATGAAVDVVTPGDDDDDKHRN